MAEARERPPSRQPRPRARLPRFSDLFDANEEMISFVDRYQQAWEAESRAMLALAEFLHQRSESMRLQVELMRAGSGTVRRYTDWSELLFRPDTFMQAFMRPPLRPEATSPTPKPEPPE